MACGLGARSWAEGAAAAAGVAGRPPAGGDTCGPRGSTGAASSACSRAGAVPESLWSEGRKCSVGGVR